MTTILAIALLAQVDIFQPPKNPVFVEVQAGDTTLYVWPTDIRRAEFDGAKCVVTIDGREPLTITDAPTVESMRLWLQWQRNNSAASEIGPGKNPPDLRPDSYDVRLSKGMAVIDHKHYSVLPQGGQWTVRGTTIADKGKEIARGKTFADAVRAMAEYWTEDIGYKDQTQ